MKKIVSILMLTLALGAFAFSQAGGGGGGQGRRGGQRGGGMQYDRAGAQYGLVSRSDVQTELKITDDQKTKLTAARTEMMTAMQGMQDLSAEERTAARTKATESYNSAIGGILTDDQKKRLMGIFLQMGKGQALTNPDAQTALGITAEQAAKIKDLVAKERAANAALPTDDPQAAREARTKNAETLNTDIMGVLTDEQKTKLTALEGDKFTPDPNIRGGFGGGGGGRGGRGGGGGNGGG